jgi:hypothetical protein
MMVESGPGEGGRSNDHFNVITMETKKLFRSLDMWMAEVSQLPGGVLT